MNNDKKNCAIVIPVYKKSLTHFELLSFTRCLEVFNNRDIHIVYPRKLSIDYYRYLGEKTNKKEIVFHPMKDNFFISIEGYNDLCLSASFYKLFQDYSYILIYQLDAYVFRDEIDKFIALNIDYIGAPVFKGYRHATQLDYIGYMNGGLSLRKVQKCISVCEQSMKLSTMVRLYRDNIYGKKNIIKIIAYRMHLLKHIPLHWEDMFYGYVASKIDNSFIMANYDEACRFAFDCLPDQLFQQCGYQLPMGCHAFYRNEEVIKVWSKYIPLAFISSTNNQ